MYTVLKLVDFSTMRSLNNNNLIKIVYATNTKQSGINEFPNHRF